MYLILQNNRGPVPRKRALHILGEFLCCFDPWPGPGWPRTECRFQGKHRILILNLQYTKKSVHPVERVRSLISGARYKSSLSCISVFFLSSWCLRLRAPKPHVYMRVWLTVILAILQLCNKIHFNLLFHPSSFFNDAYLFCVSVCVP